MKRTPLVRTAFHRKEPSCSRSEHPRAKDKECAHCHKPFTPFLSTQVVCATLRCSKGFAKAKRKAEEKAERESDRKRREALKTIPELIAEAQESFNAFIRERDREKGCFVCGRPFNQAIRGQALQAGHVRSRGAAGHLRFNELNCMGECEGCNGPHGAKPHEIEAGAVRRNGQAVFDALKADNTPHKWTREELIAIKAEFRAKRKELEKRTDQ